MHISDTGGDAKNRQIVLAGSTGGSGAGGAPKVLKITLKDSL